MQGVEQLLLNTRLCEGQTDACLGFNLALKPKIPVQSLSVCVLPVPSPEALHTFPPASHRPLWSQESPCVVTLFNGLYCPTTAPCTVESQLQGSVMLGAFLFFQLCACHGSGAVSHPSSPAPYAQSCFLLCCRNGPCRALVTASVCWRFGKGPDYRHVILNYLGSQHCAQERGCLERCGGKVLEWVL